MAIVVLSELTNHFVLSFNIINNKMKLRAMLELLSDRVRPFNATYSLIGKFASFYTHFCIIISEIEIECERFYRTFSFSALVVGYVFII